MTHMASAGWLLLWGLCASVAMSCILEGAQGLGLSRLNLPFLAGTFFTDSRARATVIGFIFYFIGGWIFAFFYFLLFASVGIYTWWFGAVLGVVHGLFLLICALPVLPFVHPRLASEYHGVTDTRRIEPPGFMATNYGLNTPLTTLLAQTLYGATLGGCLQLHLASGYVL